jgi:UDP-GlcNAc3NAcA epimerase
MPEEINRILTDKISQILLCPSDAAIENLKNE